MPPVGQEAAEVVHHIVDAPFKRRSIAVTSNIRPSGLSRFGEAGTIGPPAAIGNALGAALPKIADRITNTPRAPEGLWSWLNAATPSDAKALR
jgi:CO/xanthine dehydrogenase Mo-binding subunit